MHRLWPILRNYLGTCLQDTKKSTKNCDGSGRRTKNFEHGTFYEVGAVPTEPVHWNLNAVSRISFEPTMTANCL